MPPAPSQTKAPRQSHQVYAYASASGSKQKRGSISPATTSSIASSSTSSLGLGSMASSSTAASSATYAPSQPAHGPSRRDSHFAARPASPSKSKFGVKPQPQQQQASTSRVVPGPSQNRSLFEDEYRSEVTEYMHVMEAATSASADLMDMQPELQWYMRPFLVDFLVEIHQQFRLRPEVLYLSLNIVDRYVSKRVVYKKHYQLVGCAALWIAAKFEDAKDRVPTVRELADMCCKAYDDSAFIQMEGHVLQTIGWQIGHPTAEAWMRLACMGNINEDTKTQHVARFVMEITLFHREFVGVKASVITAGSLMLARYICGLPRHPAHPEEEDVLRVVQCLDTCFRLHAAEVSQIVIDKYAPSYYSRASTVVRDWYSSGRQYIHLPILPPASPSSLSTPSLVPSWSRGRYDTNSSPTTGAYSCSSSEAGDDMPRTPITPAHTATSDPFLVAHAAASVKVECKENIEPMQIVSGGQVYGFGQAGQAVPAVKAVSNGMVPAAYGAQGPRPVLHAIPHVQQQVMPRPLRRLSN